MKPVEAIARDIVLQQTIKADGRTSKVPGKSIGPDIGEKAQRLREILEEMGVKDGRLNPVRLHYTLHEPTGRLMVNVVDLETGEILNTMPPEKLLNTLARIMEFVGLMLDERV
jgi:uncharacterized FlaG/YvyC family protein